MSSRMHDSDIDDDIDWGDILGPSKQRGVKKKIVKHKNPYAIKKRELPTVSLFQ